MDWGYFNSASGVKFSGTVFGDYYWVASNHDTTLEEENGFWFRRIYLTVEEELDNAFTTRFRLEMASPGDFKTNGLMDPFVKDVYLAWNPSQANRHSVLLGLSPTPTWSLVENFWGYRSVEKTPLDLQEFGSSRDIGLAIKGSFDEDKKFSYHFMVGNGSGTKSETNKDKKVYLALSVGPLGGLLFEAYGDWENDKGEEPMTDVYTLQGFLYLGGEPGRVGLIASQQTRQQGVGNSDLELEIFSLFGIKRLTEKFSAYGRVDHMLDTNPDAAEIKYIPMDPFARSTLVILGLDFKAGEKVHFQPNVETVFYSKVEGVRPKEDVIPRVTIHYKF